MMQINLPLIYQFSALTQLGIIALLLVGSYLQKSARYTIIGLILAYIGFKAIVPICLWSYSVFKWIAMFGFYVTFFQVGIEFIMKGITNVYTFLDNAMKEYEKIQRGEL